MVLFRQMLVFFLLMLIGYYVARKDVFDKQTCKKISWLVINICSPALVLHSALDGDKVKGSTLLLVIGLAAAMYLVLMILGVCMPGILRRRSCSIYSPMTVFGNVGFMGYPLVLEMYGQTGLLYATLFNMLYNLLFYTYGISVISGEACDWKNLRKICNVGVCSVILAFILYLLNLPAPTFLVQTLNSIGSLTGPLCMMMIGASFVGLRVRDLFSDLSLLLFTLIRFVVFPIVFFLIIRAFITDSVILGVSLVMLAAPVGSMNLMLAQQYDGDVVTASKAISLTTALSVILLPLLSMILL